MVLVVYIFNGREKVFGFQAFSSSKFKVFKIKVDPTGK